MGKSWGNIRHAQPALLGAFLHFFYPEKLLKHAPTQILQNLLQNPEQLSIYRAKAPEHLLRHQKTAIAKAYLEVIKTAVESSK
jgi:hypothetical protein